MNTLPEELIRKIYKKVYNYVINEIQFHFKKEINFECYNCGLKFVRIEKSNIYIIYCSDYCLREYYSFNRFE